MDAESLSRSFTCANKNLADHYEMWAKITVILSLLICYYIDIIILWLILVKLLLCDYVIIYFYDLITARLHRIVFWCVMRASECLLQDCGIPLLLNWQIDAGWLAESFSLLRTSRGNLSLHRLDAVKNRIIITRRYLLYRWLKINSKTIKYTCSFHVCRILYDLI